MRVYTSDDLEEYPDLDEIVLTDDMKRSGSGLTRKKYSTLSDDDKNKYDLIRDNIEDIQCGRCGEFDLKTLPGIWLEFENYKKIIKVQKFKMTDRGEKKFLCDETIWEKSFTWGTLFCHVYCSNEQCNAVIHVRLPHIETPKKLDELCTCGLEFPRFLSSDDEEEKIKKHEKAYAKRLSTLKNNEWGHGVTGDLLNSPIKIKLHF